MTLAIVILLPQNGIRPNESAADRQENDRGVREGSAIYCHLSLCRVILPGECTYTLVLCIIHVCILIHFQCRDTFWVESLNHQMLLYVPKRIHFGSQTFKMRMNLAVLDWVS